MVVKENASSTTETDYILEGDIGITIYASATEILKGNIRIETGMLVVDELTASRNPA